MPALPAQPTASARERPLVLLGAGDTHLALLTHLARHPLTGGNIILVSPHDPAFLANSLPLFVGGQLTAAQCHANLQPLLRRTGVRWLAHRATGIDTGSRTLLLDNGDALTYGLVSINVGLVQRRAEIDLALPGAREHGLFLYGAQAFSTLWSRVQTLAHASLSRFAVIGASPLGVQVALALRQRFAHIAITVIEHDQALLADYPKRLRDTCLDTLRQQSITLLPGRARALAAGEVCLEGAARLACDVPILALQPDLPSWLEDSGMVMDAQRRLGVDNASRAAGLPTAFVHGDLISSNPPLMPRSPLQARHAGAVLKMNLARVLAGQPVKPLRVPLAGLAILHGGSRRAIASWHGLVWQGRVPAMANAWMQRRFAAQLDHAGLDNTLT